MGEERVSGEGDNCEEFGAAIQAVHPGVAALGGRAHVLLDLRLPAVDHRLRAADPAQPVHDPASRDPADAQPACAEAESTLVREDFAKL